MEGSGLRLRVGTELILQKDWRLEIGVDVTKS